MKLSIAVIGAGISGLSVAKGLEDEGNKVTVFEKSRGVGGRMSTRRADDFSFDHGAQCFTARTKAFQAFVKQYEKLGVIEEWKGKVVSIEEGKKIEKRMWFETHFVATPNMNSLCKKLAENLDVKKQSEVSEILKKNGKWHLISKNGEDLGSYDWVISTAPPNQTIGVMPKQFCYIDEISRLEMSPCFALMLGFKDQLTINWMAAKIRNSILKWVTVNSKRPERDSSVTAIQVHSKNNWADINKEEDIKLIQQQMIDELYKLTGINGNEADYVSTHRWLYALVKNTEKAKSYVDVENRLAACGDWCLTSRIEEAWISAHSVIDKICEVK